MTKLSKSTIEKIQAAYEELAEEAQALADDAQELVDTIENVSTTQEDLQQVYDDFDGDLDSLGEEMNEAAATAKSNIEDRLEKVLKAVRELQDVLAEG